MSALLNVLPENTDPLLRVYVPDRQLRDGSIQIAAPGGLFADWSQEYHAESYICMRRIAAAWQRSNITHQYLIYGKIDSRSFHWEMVPYQTCRTCIGRIVQQLQVLWRIVFVGIAVSEEGRKNQVERYEVLLSTLLESSEPSGLPRKGNDSFCQEDTIERQLVIAGEKVNVLFNYAPIGFGGERLHFLVVPKQHRATFTDVTRDEYCESLALTTQLVTHVRETRKTVKNVYLLNKTGLDAGQTVGHWHLHVIFSTNTAQDWCGKCTTMIKIVLGSSPLKEEQLANRVRELREEFSVSKR